MKNETFAIKLAKRAQKVELMKGATKDQKIALNYFIPEEGCRKIHNTKPKAFDEMMNRTLIALGDTKAKAIAKINLDESELNEIPPITFSAYEHSDYNKTEKDRTYRSNLYSITHIFFSATQVYLHKYTFDTMKNEWSEQTLEYFYEDITSFSTVNEQKEIFYRSGCLGKLQRGTIEFKKFQLVVPGDSFYCYVTDGDLLKKIKGVNGIDIESQIQAMKSKLREKKNS